MRVAVIGATGNVGTALLTALRTEAQISEIIGIARRRPDVHAAPYDAARWEQVDLAVPELEGGDEDAVVERLAQVLDGVDTVVHLAWLLQPNRDRELLRRANVTGTRRVVQACQRAGVGHLVVASSVGVYTPAPDDEARDEAKDESWPTDGIPSSHYSVDKVAQERVLDEAETAGLAVTRIRAALVFDRAAGSEIARLFIGGLLPPALLRPGRLPILPVPAGIRLQVVHGADLADAYRRVILRRATGAYNIAATPLLRAKDLADILAHGRYAELPPSLVRPLVWAGWQARAVAADPGWLDLGMSVPVMDTARARRDLDWEPQHDANSAVRELLDAIADGAGAPSAPLRPRAHWPQDQLPPGQVVPDSPIQPEAGAPDHRLPPHLERDVFSLYLSDHLAGATVGAQRSARMAAAHEGSEAGEVLERFCIELDAERVFLAELIGALELRPRAHRAAAAWLGEKVGRLKTNGRPSGSPMTPVLELELMRGAVNGKQGLWETLAELAPDLGMPPEIFLGLADQARDQRSRLEHLHHQLAGSAFRT